MFSEETRDTQSCKCIAVEGKLENIIYVRITMHRLYVGDGSEDASTSQSEIIGNRVSDKCLCGDIVKDGITCFKWIREESVSCL